MGRITKIETYDYPPHGTVVVSPSSVPTREERKTPAGIIRSKVIQLSNFITLTPLKKRQKEEDGYGRT